MDPSRSLLRQALLANGAFSTVNGLLLALAPATVGGWLGVSVDGWLRLFGLVLLGHAAILVWAATRPDLALWGRANLVVIAPYPLLMVAAAFAVSGGGVALVLLDGAIIGLMAVAQWQGLRRSGVPVAA